MHVYLQNPNHRLRRKSLEGAGDFVHIDICEILADLVTLGVRSDLGLEYCTAPLTKGL